MARALSKVFERKSNGKYMRLGVSDVSTAVTIYTRRNYFKFKNIDFRVKHDFHTAVK